LAHFVLGRASRGLTPFTQ